MCRIAVIGGGRWARVVLEELTNLIPPTKRITCHSIKNSSEMHRWVCSKGLDSRVEVFSSYPERDKKLPTMAIVVNAARDHQMAITWSLSQGFSVLVEKPVTLSAKSTKGLMGLAIDSGAYLASAHVLLFAKYLANFAHYIKVHGQIRSAKIEWHDTKSEIRYGESKFYDPGLAIYADLLPHIFSIVNVLTGRHLNICEDFQFLRGGAELRMSLGDDINLFHVEMARNAKKRVRRVIVENESDEISILDFSEEPGRIINGDINQCADPSWSNHQKPLSKMLTIFLNSCNGIEFDERLNIEKGLYVNQLIDLIEPLYRIEKNTWLKNQFKSHDIRRSDDLNYALAEIIFSEQLFEIENISFDKKIETLICFIRDNYSEVFKCFEKRINLESIKK